MKRPIALVLEIMMHAILRLMFVLNKLLETGGEYFRSRKRKDKALFKFYGWLQHAIHFNVSYDGTYQENIAHLDRWSLVANAPDLDVCQELTCIGQTGHKTTKLRHPAVKIVELARLLRKYACLAHLGVYWLNGIEYNII
ncbi:hypothetical protein ACA081_00190 [Candidatus Hodgkinia cicadicola]